MIELRRTNSDDADFLNLIKELDQDLAEKNGEKNDFFVQYNQVDFINHVVLAYQDEKAVGCGAYKQYNNETVEIKRMFVLPAFRGNGISRKILHHLELWAKDENYHFAVLETGDKMIEAIGLYQSNAYEIIQNYPPYENESTSICFKKIII